MRKIPYLPVVIFLIVCVVLAGMSFDVFARPLALGTSPVLSGTYSYSVLAGSTVTNTGPTTTNGDVGVSAGSSITGFPPGVAGPPGTIHINDTSAIAAQADNLYVFGALSQPCDQSFGAVDLVTTFPAGVPPGVYCSTSSFSINGNLVLNGTVGVWIFRTVSTLDAQTGSSVTGGDPCNVWWQVGSSATLNTTSSLIGNIFALTDIYLRTGASLAGRALAQTGQVVLDSNTITFPVCTLAPTAIVPTTGPGTPGPGLPVSGGAPIRDESLPWIFVVIVGGFVAIAAGIIYGEYRRSTNRQK